MVPHKEKKIMLDPLFLSYAAMGLMAIIPIYLGSFSIIPPPNEKKELEIMKKEDAYWFPIIGSAVLFSFYLLFKFFPKDILNILITSYFSFLGVLALTKLVSPLIRKFVFSITKYIPIEEEIKRTDPLLDTLFLPTKIEIRRQDAVLFTTSVDIFDVVSGIFASVFAVYYAVTKNWIASNIFGEAFAYGAISIINFDSFITGSIFLAGLFFYDIFWVFGTDVMVTVAKSFEAPIKLVFPRNIFAETSQFAMLGLGDIVVPGAFVALCLRFDHKRAGSPAHTRYPKPYFKACMIAYTIGLALTILVMHTFKAAQPALLYLSPACIFSVCLVALLRGEFCDVWNFSTTENEVSKPTD